MVTSDRNTFTVEATDIFPKFSDCFSPLYHLAWVSVPRGSVRPTRTWQRPNRHCNPSRRSRHAITRRFALTPSRV